MASAVKQWLTTKNKTGKALGKHDTGPRTPPEPPCRDDWPDLSASWSADAARSNYGLFQHLPLEIRQQILAYAFGNRTLHVDLTYDHPLVRKSPPQKNKLRTLLSGHGGADTKAPRRRRHCGLGSDIVRDTSQPKQWQWFSCVCHRRMVEALACWEGNPGPVPPMMRFEPCNDGCIAERRFGKPPSQWGELCRCEPIIASTDRPMADHECFIGITGWLLTCRQAYIDGTATLYSTNAFHISSLTLLLNLPRLLPPHHLATITTVELLWDFFRDRTTIRTVYAQAQRPLSPPAASDSTTTPFHTLCRQTPQHFPNVRRLYLALQADLSPPVADPAARLPLFDRAFLAPIEAMFRAMRPGGQNADFSLAIQSTGWLVLANRQWRKPVRHEREQGRWEDEYCHPETLRVRTDRGEGESGYWVKDGVGFEVLKAWVPLGEGEEEGGGYWLRPGWGDTFLIMNGGGAAEIWGTMGLD